MLEYYAAVLKKLKHVIPFVLLYVYMSKTVGEKR